MIELDVKTIFLTFLRSKKVAVIATVSSSNQPMSATIYFIVDDNLNFYFMTKAPTRKNKNIEANKEVSLVIGTENIPVTVQVQGKAEKVEDSTEFALRADQLKKVFFENTFIAPLFQMQEDDQNQIIIYKITPYWIRWLDFTDNNDKKGFIQVLP